MRLWQNCWHRIRCIDGVRLPLLLLKCFCLGLTVEELKAWRGRDHFGVNNIGGLVDVICCLPQLVIKSSALPWGRRGKFCGEYHG